MLFRLLAVLSTSCMLSCGQPRPDASLSVQREESNGARRGFDQDEGPPKLSVTVLLSEEQVHVRPRRDSSTGGLLLDVWSGEFVEGFVSLTIEREARLGAARSQYVRVDRILAERLVLGYLTEGDTSVDVFEIVAPTRDRYVGSCIGLVGGRSMCEVSWVERDLLFKVTPFSRERLREVLDSREAVAAAAREAMGQ
jgi:hypothetical protein